MNEMVEFAKGLEAEANLCASCGASGLSIRAEPQVFTYGEGDDAVDLNALVRVYSCADCGIEYTDDEAEDARHEAVCRHLGLLTPREIREIREKRFKLSREKFSQVTGFGVATIARWEGGQLLQNVANDRYLRLLSCGDNPSRLEAIVAKRDFTQAPASPPRSRRFPSIERKPRLERMGQQFQLHRRR